MTSDAASRSLRRAFLEFEFLLDLAEHACRRHQYPLAAACARLAARQAFTCHTGLFVSPRLERILSKIGRATVPASDDEPPRSSRVDRVLHVLTYARPVGGDTRFVWRWMKADRSRAHSVVITHGQAEEVPQLDAAVAESGGTIHRLRAPQSDLVGRARELRRLARHFDLVVLHPFPDDVVPSLAFAARFETAPVVFMNLSDHTFWAGAGVSHVVAMLREGPSGFLERRRLLDAGRTGWLPVPLDPPNRNVSRTDAKRLLGVPAGSLFILSIASAFKYDPFDGPGWIDLMLPIVGAHPNVVVGVVGPEPRGSWADVQERTGGRVRAWGRRWDTAVFYEAADIYVDSFPFTSPTSALEAGSYAVPLVAYCPYEGDAALLSAGAPGLTDTIVRARHAGELNGHLARLIVDPQLRMRVASMTQEAVIAAHTGEGWLRALDGLYRQAMAAPAPVVDEHLPDPFQDTVFDQFVKRLTGRLSIGLGPLIDTYLEPMPYSVRFPVLVKLARLDRSFSFSLLCPNWLRCMIEGRWSALRRLARA
jgi:hypothetical protein